MIADLADEQLERIAAALPERGDENWELLQAAKAAALLGRLTEPNRRALLHLAALARSSGRWPALDLICAVAKHYGAEEATTAAGFGWTPAPGRVLAVQETIALQVSQQVLLSLSWEEEEQLG